MRATLLLAASLLAATIPTLAQDRAQVVSVTAYAPPIVPSSFPVPPMSPVTVQPRLLLRIRPIPPAVSFEARGQESFRLAAGPQFDPIVSLDGIVGRNDTDFAAERLFPMIAPAKGKIELSGYYGLRPMENMLMGLPGAGVLPAWSVTRQAHPAIVTPYTDVSYGLTMKIHFHHDADGSLHAAGLHCLGKLVGKGQGCHIIYY